MNETNDSLLSHRGDTSSDRGSGSRTNRESFEALLVSYADSFPEEAAAVDQFRWFLHSHADVFERHHQSGHFTASCWLVSADGERLLITHHRKLERWLQLGGHCDGDCDVHAAALREAREESGLNELRIEPALFDIDRHRIPARAGEPEHWHYDLRFVIRAVGSETFSVSQESHALAWRRISGLWEDSATEASIRRMAKKWLQQDVA